jgi:hypothetical protein
MKASRSFIPGGWFCFGGEPPAVRGQSWLLLAAAMLLLAGRPVAGADAALPAWLEDDDGAPAEEFSGDAPVFHTKDAPSDAQVWQRVRNSAGLRGIFSITRDHDSGSAASGNPRGVVLTSAPRHFLPQLPPEQRSLAVFTAGVIVRHFEKLSTWSGQSGAGVLYPINARVGLFVDARTVMPNGSRYYGIARGGLRILF